MVSDSFCCFSWLELGVSRCQLEVEFVAAERVAQFGALPAEAAIEAASAAFVEWPEAGRIVIRKLGLRYRPGLDWVLNDLDAVIPAGAKVAVVGRTGAGKSVVTSNCLVS